MTDTRKQRFIQALELEDNHKLLIDLLTYDTDQERDEISGALANISWILPRVCKLGYDDILQRIFDFHVINLDEAKYQGKTGLQHASEKGHTDIVKWLLKHEAKLKESIWEEDSEFYLATLNGKEDVVDVLLSRKPRLTKDQAVRDCLMYAACMGGHIKLVKKWLTPSTNIRESIAFTPDLNVCERRYPLFAACQGQHLEVAEFLINDMDASITEDICACFPEFTTKLVRSMFLISDEKGEKHFKMSSCNLEHMLTCWFTEEKEDNLKASEDVPAGEADFGSERNLNIDIQKNRLTVLPDGVLWALKELASLNASHNPLRTIFDAQEPDSLHLNQLRSLKLMHCDLEYLSTHIFALPCLEELNLSCNKLSTLSATGAGNRTAWKCSRLRYLDISQNRLASLPHGIVACEQLNILNASHNCITAECMSWQCPMQILNLSYNKLTSFAPNADQYWGKTLMELCLQQNEITQLPETIVKMSILAVLDISHNKIERLPPPSLWMCPLSSLNLSDNNLGAREHGRVLEFPESCLSSSLMSLCLAGNNLVSVPTSVCFLQKLGMLDLSRNPKITNLPTELGNLKNLYELKVMGIRVKDKELQKMISCQSSESLTTPDVIAYLERKHRKCVSPGILKVVVLGCENIHGHCIAQELAANRSEKRNSHQNLMITQMKKHKDTLKAAIWELPDTAITSAILPIFLSHNSLYLIVIDVNLSNTDMNIELERVCKKILRIVSSIQIFKTRVLFPHILVVYNFVKSVATSDPRRKEILIKSMDRFPRILFVSATIGNSEDLVSLRQKITSTWENMRDDRFERDIQLCQRQVPGVFLEIIQNIESKRNQLDVCTMEEFLQIAKCSKLDLEDGIDHRLKLHEFLLQTGVIIHYEAHFKELSDCVVLNPTWLYQLLSKIMELLIKSKKAQMSVTTLREEVKNMLPKTDYDYFPAIIQLLEASGIGMRIMDSTNVEEILLVPCLLQESKPVILHDKKTKAARLFCLPNIPSTFWSHVISQLVQALGRFFECTWNSEEQKSESFNAVCENKCCETSTKGLHSNNKMIQYWRTGIMMYDDQGYVVVEQIDCTSRTKNSVPGVLVTVRATGRVNDHNNQHHSRNLSIMGIVVDELLEITEFFNPKFRYPNNAETEEIYALCPHCFDLEPESQSVSLDGIHFTVKDCAQQILLSKDVITCEKGPSCLGCLVPDFMLMDLPYELHLTAEDLSVSEQKLGHGMVGDVKKGTCKGSDVAIKVFYDLTIQQCMEENNDQRYQNAKDAAEVFMQQKNADIIEQSKVINTFSDFRKEAGFLCKLQHESIITFIGVCIKPRLLLVMELAPLGCLRDELKKRTNLQKRNTSHSSCEVSKMVFSKDLTYKFVLQIGCALSYLHKNNIIYRDLKPDNILIMSLSDNDRVNLKLSDYGISKFATLQGASGCSGTLGYMAPEVVKQYYTEKVDIYSYGIVMLEILTGLPPSGKPRFSKTCVDQIPFHVQGWKIHCNFPYLEKLMKECWNHEMDKRPSSKNIVKRIKSDQFLLLHDSISLDKSMPENLEVTCIYACETVKRWNIWICESGHGSHRYISVYDVELSSFIIVRKTCPGPRVSSMAKVGPNIWIVCKDVDYLEVIKRSHNGHFEICRGVSLNAKAIKILSHSLGTSEDTSVILVGLENGSVTIFQFNASNKKSEIQFSINKPITAMCSVYHSLVTVACGATVNFLHMKLPDNQGHDIHAQQDIQASELTICGCVCLKSVIKKDAPVVSMVAQDIFVWCSLECESCIVKIDVHLKTVLLVLNLFWDSIHDVVTLQERESGSNIQLIVTEGGAASKTPKHHDAQNELNHFVISSNDVFTKTETYSCDNDADIDTVPNKFDLNRDRSVTAPIYNTYPGLNSERKRTVSMPVFSTAKPPLLPKRTHRQEVHIDVTSLESSADILIIGTSCGGIVLLPVACTRTSDKSPSAFPIQFPVLRHPTEKKESQTKPGSYTAVTSDLAMIATGAISVLTLVNDKLVSLHTSTQHEPCCQNSQSESFHKKQDFTFTKILTSGNSTEQASTSVKFTDSFHSVSEVANPGKASATVGLQPFEVADIAVWDKITCSRLKTVRSYGHDLRNCTGWCCRAFDCSFEL